MGRCFFVYTDAALAGAPVPSLGGFLHGYYFSFPLPVDMLGYPIPVLEFLAIVAAAVVFPLILCGARAVLVTDSLTSSLAINNDGAHTDEMQWVHTKLIEITAATPVFAATRHGYGETNPCADLASRGRLEELHELCAQLGVTPRRLEMPPAFSDLFLLFRSTFGPRWARPGALRARPPAPPRFAVRATPSPAAPPPPPSSLTSNAAAVGP
jgi:hypothetical protein